MIWTITSGGLPPGLELMPSGLLRGTPTNPGFYSVGLRVDDSVGNAAGEVFDFVFVDPLVINTSFIADITVNSPIDVTLSGSGGVGPYKWEIIEGKLPSGVSFSEEGHFSGLSQSSEKVEFTVSVSDSGEQKTIKNLSFGIVENLELVSSVIPPAVSGENYSFELFTEGGTPPYSWSLLRGSFPDGIALGDDGIISGVTNIVSNSQVSIKVTDQAGRSSSFPYVFSVSVGGNRQEIAARGGTVFIDIDQNELKYIENAPNNGFNGYLIISTSEKVQVHFIGDDGQIPSWVLCELASPSICSFD